MPAAEARQTSNVRMGCGGLERARGIKRQYSRANGSRERYWPAADTRPVPSSKPGTAWSWTIARDRNAWMMMANLLLVSGGVLGMFRDGHATVTFAANASPHQARRPSRNQHHSSGHQHAPSESMIQPDWRANWPANGMGD
ncbi:hypothetical protein BCR34DRAFT_645326 [Clohesyomyces aquaticus]|uniref:Uncharacterized protein n=1 Tax=Clohesyomyces aquaticus TaxID=1231657 RepID=A0A1Y1ZYF8_9PLEO|nr:hypothetical protein BCR34DRAFT_645326 [Clohesyomyces aquaticus]